MTTKRHSVLGAASTFRRFPNYARWRSQNPSFFLSLPYIAANSPSLAEVHIDGLAEIDHDDMQKQQDLCGKTFQDVCSSMQAFRHSTVAAFNTDWMQCFLNAVQPRAAEVLVGLDWPPPTSLTQSTSSLKYLSNYADLRSFDMDYPGIELDLSSRSILRDERVTLPIREAMLEYMKQECAGRGVALGMRVLKANWQDAYDGTVSEHLLEWRREIS